VLLTVDASGSMVTTSLYWDHDQNPGTPNISRWQSTHSVINGIVTNFDATMELGLLFFPQLGLPKDCNVGGAPDVAVGRMAGSAILAALPPANTFDDLWQNPTPTTDGLQVAADHMLSLPGENPKAIILMTDGIPSCGNTYDGAIAVASNAFANGMPTYLVGIDITSGVFADFNSLAVAGGVPKQGGSEQFYNANNEIELEEALATIVDDVLTCEIQLDPEPDFPQFVKVFVGGVEYFQVDDCNTETGWIYSEEFSEITLCGMACDELKNLGEADIEYHCTPG